MASYHQISLGLLINPGNWLFNDQANVKVMRCVVSKLAGCFPATFPLSFRQKSLPKLENKNTVVGKYGAWKLNLLLNLR